MASRKKASRKSKRRAAKPTQDETVEAKAGAGVQLKLPEGSKIKHHLANVEAWEKKLADMKAHVKKAYEGAAAERVSKTLLKELIALKGGDPIVYRHYLESLGVGLEVIGAPFQLNVFDTMYESDVAQAKAEGAAAARAGRSPECRFAEGSDAANAYLEQYREVQANMVPGASKLTAAEIKGAVKTGSQAAPLN